MSAINFVNTLTSAIIGMVAIGGIFIGGYNALKMISAEDEYDASKCKKNIKKVVKGVILGLSISGLIKYILNIL